METAPIDENFLARMRSDNEEVRYQALLEIQEGARIPDPTALEVLRGMTEDSSRLVRQLAKELFARLAVSAGLPAEALPLSAEEEKSPGSTLLAIISVGSSLTGAYAVGLSLLTYYLMDRFPFPEPLDVLAVVSLVLVVPYLVLGLLLLAPGRIQKLLAQYYAYFSLILSLVLIAGLQPAFDTWWYYQFTEADQAQFHYFLSPFQLAMAFLPVIAGQLMQIYYSSQYLAETAPRVGGNPVDTRTERD